jgi:hypothetical protein
MVSNPQPYIFFAFAIAATGILAFSVALFKQRLKLRALLHSAEEHFSIKEH